MGLPGKPTSRKAWYTLVAREGWSWIEVAGKGGKTGRRKEYRPPDDVLQLIAARAGAGGADVPEVRYVTAPESAGAKVGVECPGNGEYAVNRAFPAGQVDADLLRLVASACAAVLGNGYEEGETGDQVRIAAGAYNVLVGLFGHIQGGIDALRRLDQEGLTSQVRLLFQMGLLQSPPESQSSD
jgi:hypothetical protein